MPNVCKCWVEKTPRAKRDEKPLGWVGKTPRAKRDKKPLGWVGKTPRAKRDEKPLGWVGKTPRAKRDEKPLRWGLLTGMPPGIHFYVPYSFPPRSELIL